jgi:hypothetical protein
MGSVTFARVRWYNAFFLGLAPLLLLPLAYALLAWRLKGQPAMGWEEALWLYLIANLVYAALPSWLDLKVAARSPVGWLLLAAAAAYGWHRFRTPPADPVSRLEQLEVACGPRVHPSFGHPGAGVRLGQPYEIG